MNQRILKIAQETDAWCDQRYLGEDSYNIEWENKFAELIVQECVNICDEVQWQYGQYTFTATTVKNRVKERFGVEP